MRRPSNFSSSGTTRRVSLPILVALSLSACDKGSGDGESQKQVTGTAGGTTVLEPTATASTTAAEELCQLGQSEAECEAKEECLFLPAGERAVVDGECVGVDAGAGWCMELPVGSQHTPSWWYELETGRVFVFPDTPFPPPEGWVMCGCQGLGPPACGCNPFCDLGDSGGST